MIKKNIDWLPHKKYYEFAYHKYFNPEVVYDQWEPWDEWDYPDRDLLRFKHIIAEQIKYVSNKKVLDLACHLGYTSLFCLHNGAESVTGTNIRDKEIQISNEICTYAGYKNFKFLNSNLYNKKELKKLCNNHDTIYFTGVLYHLNNHFEILETLCQSKARTIIIESKVPMNNYEYDCEDPLILWDNEDTSKSYNGWYYQEPVAYVGIPNTCWIIEALKNLGMEIVYNKSIEYRKSNGKMTRRTIITANKK